MAPAPAQRRLENAERRSTIRGPASRAPDNVALVYGVIGIITICIAVFFRLFTALGDAQRCVDERQAEEQRRSAEAVTA